MSKVSADAYVGKVYEIYDENPSYETGHDGSDGQCDCIGMCRGALKRAGATDISNMRGTNQAARHTIENLHQFSSASELNVGDVVLKTRDKDDPNMPLPDKYRKGGSDYSEKWGETNFTHIGTVTKTNPLEITHMTSPHALKDTKIGTWSYVGQLPWVGEGGGGGGGGGDDPMKARVYAESGTTVNMRKKPSTSSALVERVPIGSIVDVLEKGDEWCKIAYCDSAGCTWRGYMMTQFLQFLDDPDTPDIDPVDPDVDPVDPDDDEYITVKRSDLLRVYNEIGAMLKTVG